MQIALTLNDVHVGYYVNNQYHAVLKGANLQLKTGRIMGLFGTSGCGKTTLLRAVAGFEPVQKGSILLGDKELSSTKIHIPPEQRGIGMVFQDYALFPHLNAEQNIAFGLQKYDRNAKTKRVQELFELIRLADAAKKYPHELSGGQQQRIALARALAPKPAVVLLDEPFSNLDAETTKHLIPEVRDILKVAGQTALLVSHNQQEARLLADETATIEAGEVLVDA